MFIGLTPRAKADSLAELRSRAILTAGTYLAHGWLRHHPGQGAAYAAQALRQSLLELATNGEGR